MSPRLDMAAVTHPGTVRSHNEDCIATDPSGRFALLADGMGGHNAGEVASRLTVEVVRAGLSAELERSALDGTRAEALLQTCVARANRAVLDAASANAAYEGMGTTLVAALWHDGGVSYAHVGDSRLYRLRADALQRLTRDHSLVQEQVESGEITARAARHAPHRNVLTRAVGAAAALQADVATDHAAADDLYLLCSDGLTDMVTEEAIRRTLLDPHADLEGAARRLVEQANENGGADNISVILARVLRVTPSTT